MAALASNFILFDFEGTGFHYITFVAQLMVELCCILPKRHQSNHFTVMRPFSFRGAYPQTPPKLNFLNLPPHFSKRPVTTDMHYTLNATHMPAKGTVTHKMMKTVIVCGLTCVCLNVCNCGCCVSKVTPVGWYHMACPSSSSMKTH